MNSTSLATHPPQARGPAMVPRMRKEPTPLLCGCLPGRPCPEMVRLLVLYESAFQAQHLNPTEAGALDLHQMKDAMLEHKRAGIPRGNLPPWEKYLEPLPEPHDNEGNTPR